MSWIYVPKKTVLEVVSKQMRLCDTDFNLDFPQKEFEKQFANVHFHKTLIPTHKIKCSTNPKQHNRLSTFAKSV